MGLRTPWKGKPFWSRWVCFLRVRHVFGLDALWLTHQPMSEIFLASSQTYSITYLSDTLGFGQPGHCAQGSDRYLSACECLGFQDSHSVNTYMHTHKKNSEQRCFELDIRYIFLPFPFPSPSESFPIPKLQYSAWEAIYLNYRIKGFTFYKS